MNGRERILAALRGQPVDRVPVMLHNFLMAAREAGVSMAEFRRSGKAIARSFIQAVETYGYDGVVVDVDTAMLAGAVGVPVDFPDDMPARCHEPLLTRLTDVSKLKPVRVEDYFEIRAAVEAVSLLKEYFKGEIAVRGNCDQCPFSLAGLIRGLAGWMTDLVEGPEELVRELLEYAKGVTKQFLGLMAEAGADILSNGDSPAGPDMISPRMYRTFAQPSEKEIAAESHRLGRPYILHICGKTDLVLDDMAATGADGLELDTKTDMRLARERFEGKTTFIGNIDPSGVLALGTPALVEKKTRELLDVFTGTSRFILNAGCAIPAETPSENLKAMLRARD
jgi:MtaA/CmuA family methyltransferase